ANAKANTGVTEKKVTESSKDHHTNHPSWVDMVKECITAHPDDARHGVSRPTIKKFVEIKYKIYPNQTSNSQLARAITHGAEKGIFVLPKGPSGKIKLPPKGSSPHETTKENTSAGAKAPISSAKASTKKVVPAKAQPTGAAMKKKMAAVKATPSAKPGVKKTYTSRKVAAAKKSRIAATRKRGPVTKAARGITRKTRSKGGSVKASAKEKPATASRKGANKKTTTK
ncbi:hypothetical protein HETIRDRAFT_246587, partial [Heterobasidion irregulare TC 32-1]